MRSIGRAASALRAQPGAGQLYAALRQAFRILKPGRSLALVRSIIPCPTQTSVEHGPDLRSTSLGPRLRLGMFRGQTTHVAGKASLHMQTPPIAPICSTWQRLSLGCAYKLWGACSQWNGGREEDNRRTLQGAWKFFHSQMPFWKANGKWQNEMRLALIGVPCLAWCSGSRHWTQSELTSAKTAWVLMTRHIAGWWPQAGEEYPQYVRRTTRWAEALRESAGVPRWDAAVAATWWRWAGHLARSSQRGPTRWECAIAAWRRPVALGRAA